MARFLIVKGVAGRKLLDPRTIGMMQHFVSHERKVVGKRPDPLDARQTIDKLDHVFTGEEERVPEPFADNYFRRQILDGCIDYVGTVDVDAEGKESQTREFDLVRATSINKAVREREAEELKTHLKAAEEAAEKAATEADDAGKLHLEALDKAKAEAKKAKDEAEKAATDKAPKTAGDPAPKSAKASNTDPA